MGLTLCFDYRAQMDFAEAQKVVRRLHRFARRLPLDDVSPIRRLDPRDEWDRLTAVHYEMRPVPDGREVSVAVPALDAVWFAVNHPGSETAVFGLGYRPQIAEADGVPVETGLEGMCSWHACCKTQYAGLPDEGGDENFLNVHTSLVAVLDEAARLGLEVDVRDDGGYWVHRDPEILLGELGNWNRMVARLAGRLIDAFGDTLGPPVAPILAHPAFEHLEAEGGDLAPPEPPVGADDYLPRRNQQGGR